MLLTQSKLCRELIVDEEELGSVEVSAHSCKSTNLENASSGSDTWDLEVSHCDLIEDEGENDVVKLVHGGADQKRETSRPIHAAKSRAQVAARNTSWNACLYSVTD